MLSVVGLMIVNRAIWTVGMRFMVVGCVREGSTDTVDSMGGDGFGWRMRLRRNM